MKKLTQEEKIRVASLARKLFVLQPTEAKDAKEAIWRCIGIAEEVERTLTRYKREVEDDE